MATPDMSSRSRPAVVPAAARRCARRASAVWIAGRIRRMVFVLMLLLAWPHAAWAHAHLKRSDPAAGARVAPPTVIRLWFTEAPELVETRVTLVDSAGTVVPLGAVERDADGPLALRVRLPAPLAPGSYRVRWSTAAADGHPSNGSFAFAILAATIATPVAAGTTGGEARGAPPIAPPIPRAAPVSAVDTAEPSASTPAYIAARAVSFGALLAVIGAVVFRVAVLERATALEPSVRDALASRAASVAAGATVLLLLGASARLLLQTAMMSPGAALDAAHLRTMTMETHWGAAWIVQIAAAAVALAGFLLARRGNVAGWLVAGVSSLALAVSPGLGGHAAASTRYPGLAIPVDALHVLGAAGWLGSLLFVALVGLPVVAVECSRAVSDAGSHDSPWRAAAALVHAFSPTALVCAGLVALTGVVSAWLRLGSVPALWTSGYGRVLLIKLAVLAGVAATGAYNWRRVRPALGTEAATTRLRRSIAVELGIGLLVVIVTAVLVATPTPTDVG